MTGNTSDQPGTTAHDVASPNEHQIVGARLREAREVISLSQGDVATALGIPRTSVVAMEAGRRNVTGLELRRLARLYRRDVAWLLGDNAAPSAAADTALFHATAELTPEDRDQVLRFAQFLAAGGTRRRGDPPGAD